MIAHQATPVGSSADFGTVKQYFGRSIDFFGVGQRLRRRTDN
jgi:hypothetical protein